jgi:hypothetical protein
MSYFGLSRRTRTFLLWTARLALVVYLVQLSAVDHWHADFSDVVGVEGSSAHVQHCHGAGDCSSGDSAAFSVASQPVALPVPSLFTYGLENPSQLAPRAAFIAPPIQPPQAA